MSKYKVTVKVWTIIDATETVPEHQEVTKEWTNVLEADNAEDAKTKVFDGYSYICRESSGSSEVDVEVIGEADPSLPVTFWEDWAEREHEERNPHEIEACMETELERGQQ